MSEECCCRKKHRDEAEYRDLMNRLSRVEGQIRGIRGMVEDEVYCVDILTQVAAAQSALASFGRELLGNHVRTCVAEDIRNGGDEKIEELTELLKRFVK